MIKATALIDSNNFYASCEQSLDPSLIGQPVVVLSNNDGCIIARSTEARALGITMGEPYFKVRNKLKRFGVAIRSSNYALYGDMSQRLMSLLKANCEELEIYSIDEAFAHTNRYSNKDIALWGRQLRALIRRDLGLSISIGFGCNKSQAKLANHLAKSLPTNAGIFDLTSTINQDNWLETIAIEEVWGIGRKLARRLRIQGITTARQLRDMPSGIIRSKCGITGIRLQNELKGEICLPLTLETAQKQETCVSRSFSHPISSLKELRQALASYVERASEKLRRQAQLANTITAFARTSPFLPVVYNKNVTIKLDTASNDTAVLMAATLPLAEKIFQPHISLLKAGVIMQDLQSTEHLQLHLLTQYCPDKQHERARLMMTIDKINQRYGKRAIYWAGCGLNPKWGMRRDRLSRASTTRIEEVPIVNA